MSMRKALTQERLFFGNITRRVHVSHEWGSLYCGDCGTWPDDYAARVPCKGPAWPAVALPDDGREEDADDVDRWGIVDRYNAAQARPVTSDDGREGLGDPVSEVGRVVGRVADRMGLMSEAEFAAAFEAGRHHKDDPTFDDLLTWAEALLTHYPPDTIVCSHSVKADIGAQTVAGIADLVASCRALLPAVKP